MPYSTARYLKEDNKSDIEKLIVRQNTLEDEIQSLKNYIRNMKDANELKLAKVNERIDTLEKDIKEIRLAIHEMKTNIDTIKDMTVKVSTNVGEINTKQDVAINAQDKFISQLWKAFFSVLGVTVALLTGAIAFLK